MRAMTDRTIAASLPGTLFTVPEAAWATNTAVRFVNNEVDKKIVQTRLGGRRLLDRSDLSYLRVVREFHDELKIELRRRIYQEVRNAIQHGNIKRINFDAFALRLRAIVVEIDKRIGGINAARASVQVDARICGGDPVVRGTRISIRYLGDMARRGATKDDLGKAYDLSLRQVDLALLYDQLYPRRGRPTQNPIDDSLSDLGENIRAEVDVLGEYPNP